MKSGDFLVGKLYFMTFSYPYSFFFLEMIVLNGIFFVFKGFVNLNEDLGV